MPSLAAAFVFIDGCQRDGNNGEMPPGGPLACTRTTGIKHGRMTARTAAPTSCAQSGRVARGQVPGAIRELLGVFVGLPGRLSFGGFTLDVESRQLHRGTDAQAVHLSPKGFELLRILIEARPRAIAKRELHERLWPDTFVSEATLSSLVAEVREALGERGRQAQFIRTLHGYGYSFAADAAPSASGVGAISNWVVCEGREIALADGEHILGRDADAKVELRSPAVSRHHARIVISGTSATLEDLGSKNGTTVRGQAVTAPRATGRRRRDPNWQLRAQLPDCQRQGLNQVGRRIVTAVPLQRRSFPPPLASFLGWHDGRFA